MTGLTAGTAYSFTVQARDAAGNVSAASVGRLGHHEVRPSTGAARSSYTANSWNTGFTASVKVTNTGTSALSSWTLGFSFANGQKVTQGWSADWSQSGTAVTAKNAAWNGTLAAGQTADIGFNGSHTGTNNTPDGLHAERCHLHHRLIYGLTNGPVLHGGPPLGMSGLPDTFRTEENRVPTHRLRVIATSVAATAALAAPLVLGAVPANAATGDDWLHISGNKIVDESGNEVWLTGTNWFGFNAERAGLPRPVVRQHHHDHQEHGRPRHQHRPRADLHPAAAGVEGRRRSRKPNVNTYANPELVGKNNLQIFDYWLPLCEQYGIKVILDVHSAEADNSGHIYPVWWKGSITTEHVLRRAGSG